MALLSWIVMVTRLGSARVTFALSTYGSLLKMRLAAEIRLMKIRLSPNVDLQFHIDIPSENPIRVAPLIFISLFENAFKHGISPVKPSFIHIKIYSSGPDALSCSIENSYFPKQRNDISGSGIGLEQVQKRLDLIYPGKYEWTKGCDENATVYKSTITIHTTTKGLLNA